MQTKTILISILILMFFLVLPFVAIADTASASFTAPVERVDGTPLLQSEIAGYNIYSNGVVLPDPDGVLATTLPSDATSFSVNLGANTLLHLTTVDTDGRESLPSVSMNLIAKAIPKTVTVDWPNVKITIQRK